MQNFKPLGEMLKTTWNHFEKNWANLVGISALFSIALFIIIFILVFGIVFLQIAGIFGSLPLINSGDTANTAIGGILLVTIIVSCCFIIFLVVFGISFFVQSWLMSSLITAVAKKYPEGAKVIDIIKLGWKKIWPVFLAFVLISLIVFAGLICFIIPGIIFGLWLSQVFFLVVLENMPIIEAIKKSKNMVNGYLGTIFLYNLAAMGLVYLVMMVISIIPILGFLASPLLGIIISPLLLIFQYQIFLELKKLKNC